MSVQFKVIDGHIHADSLFGNSHFQDCIEIYKRHRCRFHPATKSWIIPLPSFEDVVDEIGELEQVYITDATQSAIESLRNPVSEIVKTRTSIELDELKAPPKIGKPPHENYQLEDIYRIVSSNRFALFNTQGTGKSYESISGLEVLRNRGLVQKILFITSPSGVLNIKKELERFSEFKNISIGNKKNRTPFTKDIDVVVCNYRSFLLISDEYQKARDKGKKKTKDYRSTPIPVEEWLGDSIGALVLDESHFIANPGARQTKVIHLVAPFFYRRYLLTGTPYDKEEKLYSQLKILDSALVKGFSYQDWLSEYAVLGNKFSAYAINYFKPKKIKELQDIVSSVSVRRLATDVLILPENLITPIYIPFEEEHKDLYQELVVWNLEKIQKSKRDFTISAIINDFGKFLLAIDNPALLEKHIDDTMPPRLVKAIKNWGFDKHSKEEVLLDLLQKHEDSKIIIWTSHPSVGFELERLLQKKLPIIINGEVKPPKGMLLDEFKMTTVDRFLTSKTQNILIAGIQSLNTAITAVQANVQIYFDINFNFTEYDQSMYRIHRIGQEKTVYTYPLIIDESLDVIRYQSMIDKDFINKKFLTKNYLDKQLAKELFSATGV